MITDKNEAFHHNACKKLAQLSKVIYAMGAQKQDRADSYYDLVDDFDEVIVDTINQHQFQLDSISNSLYKYRKKCITSSCKLFGSAYKQTKTDYANFISEQNEKYLNLINEIKSIEKEIRDFQMKALQAAASFLDNSEEIQKDLALQINSTNKNSKNIRKELRPLLEKIVSLEDNLKSKLNAIRNEYKKKKQEIKNDYQNNLNDLYSNLNPFLIEKKDQLILLKDEIVDLTNKTSQIIKSHQLFAQNQLKLRNHIVADTNQTIRSIQKQIRSTSETKPSDSYFKSIIKNLQQIKIQNQMKFKKKMDQFTKETHQIKHQRHNLDRSKSAQISLIEKQFSDQFAFESQNFDLQRNHLIESNNYHLDLVKTVLNDTQNLYSKLSQLITKSIQNENSNKSFFVHGNEQMTNSFTKHYKDFIQTYKKNLFSYIDEYDKLINKTTFNFSNEIESNKQISSQLKELQNHFSKKKESKIAKAQKELNDYRKTREEKKQNLIEYSESSFKQKVGTKRKKITEIQSRFKSDLESKNESIISENQQKIQTNKKSIFDNALDLTKEIKENTTNMSKLKAKSQFYDQQIEQLKKINSKKIEVLDQQIVNLDKSIRQFQRSVKNETQKIDEDYEIQIQIKQVDLKNKIENISKLYTNDENQRGIKIIEEIRKIKDTKNLTLNDILRKTHEKEDMINNQIKKKKELKEKIKNFKSNQRENELKEEIEKISENNKKIMFNSSRKMLESISKIKKEIETNKGKIEREFSSINNLISSEKSKFNNEIEQIKSQKIQIEAETNQKIEEIDKKYKNKLEKVDFEHQKELKAVQKRIENAKKIYNEYLESSNNEETQLIQKLDNEALVKRAELYKKLNFVDSSELDYKMKSLLISKSSLLNPPEPFTIRKEDEVSISNLQKKASQKTKNLSIEFNKHIDNMNNIFKAKVNDDSSSIVNKCIKISRNESGNHKKMPQLITPQLVF